MSGGGGDEAATGYKEDTVMKMKRTARKAWKTDTGVQLVLWTWPENSPRKPKGNSLAAYNPFDPFR